MNKHYFTLGSVFAGLSVALSAFGAHGLKGVLSERMLVVFHTAAEYQMYHSLALLLTVLFSFYSPGAKTLTWSARFFLAGIILFSGSLYMLALSGMTWLGAITPIGGIFLIVGWLMLALFAIKSPMPQKNCSDK